MNEFVVGDFRFRIKKMNAIELLAVKNTIAFNTADELKHTYEGLLEKIEVNIKNDDWLQVKQGNTYYPVGIEDDVEVIDALITNILQYIKSVFTKSNASNSKQE